MLDLSLKSNREADIPNNIIMYSNTDFVRSKTDQKSTGSYVFILTRGTISYSSKFQPIIIFWTCEIEYIAMYEAKKEAIWLGYLLVELGFLKKSTLVTLYANNQGLITFSNNSNLTIKQNILIYNFIRLVKLYLWSSSKSYTSLN